MNITIIGAGNVGSSVASGAVTAGHTVTVAAPDEAEVQATASQTGAQGSTDLPAAVADADLVVLAVPYGALPDVAATVDGLRGTQLTHTGNTPARRNGTSVPRRGATP